MLPIEILMQAVVVTCVVVQEKRGWVGLPSTGAALEKCGVLFWIADSDAQRLIPAVRDGE